MKFERIAVNPEIVMGKPCVKGTRITVELIVKKLGEGYSYEELLQAYPKLTLEDIQEVLTYTYAILTNEKVIEQTAI